MNKLLRTIYATGQVEDEAGHLINCFPTSVSFETGSLLYDLVRRERLSKTVEIGLAYGVSALFICQALKDNDSGKHTAIDPAQETSWASIGRLNIERAGFGDIFRLCASPAHEVLPKLLLEGESFDFAFIDGMHLFDYALLEFFYIDRMLEIGGYIVFDDIWMPAIRKVVSFVLSNRGYEIVRSQAGKGRISSRMISSVRRFVQEPLSRDWTIKLIQGNVCVVRKLAEDNRQWKHYRTF